MNIGSLRMLVAACEGEPVSGSLQAGVRQVRTDSRLLEPGDLFVALRGPRFDGHEFVAEAGRRGAAAVLVERGRVPAASPGCAVIAVEDTRRALGRLGHWHRGRFNLPLVAVGGSNGKTTTKELLLSVLSQKLAVIGSEASFNNDVGVPLTLLRLEPEHQAAVVEVGTNHPGELAPLVEMAAPTHGVITNIGREHLEFFGNLAGVALEEGSLAELLPPTGILFLNGDDAASHDLAARTRARVVRVGLGAGNDWRVLGARVDAQGTTFQAETAQAKYAGRYQMSLIGRHQAVNALFAIALGAELGLERNQLERGLAQCQPAKMRLQMWEASGLRVLDDAYNANADSMAAALQTLQEFPCRGRRVAVLGDMAELGVHSQAAHEEVGRRAAEFGVGQLFAVGKMASIMAQGARGAGLSRVLEFADVESAAAAVRSFVRSGDVVLLKASRASRLERISESLRTWEGAGRN